MPQEAPVEPTEPKVEDKPVLKDEAKQPEATAITTAPAEKS